MATIEAELASRQECVAILAGTGRLPEIIARELSKAGTTVFVLSLTHETNGWQNAYANAYVPVTHLSGIVRTLHSQSIKTVVLAGGISVRPSWFSFRIDWTVLKQLPRLIHALRKGDDGLLRTAIAWLGEQGFSVVGAHELAPSLLAPEGVLSLLSPGPEDQPDIEAAIAAAVTLGAADVGQAAVARAGTVIARETREGTGAMLAALARKVDGFQRSGVLAKFSKPGQELRADLPAIGPDTVTQAARAGLAGIVVEAGRAFILDRELVVARANALGIFVVGVRGQTS